MKKIDITWKGETKKVSFTDPQARIIERLLNGEIYGMLGYTPRQGVKHCHVRKVMAHFGGVWVSRMQIGSGCKCHLRANEIPMTGRIVCNVSKHVCAVVDGVLNDTYDCSRQGDRCVYGYWMFNLNR